MRIGSLDGEAIDIGAIESRDVDRRLDVPSENPPERGAERNFLGAERLELQVLLKARRCLVARDDVQELRLTRIVLLFRRRSI